MALVPSNPGWYSGYVPSAAEWAQEWSSKVDFPAPIWQGGTGAQSADLANYNLQQRKLLQGSSPIQLLPLNFYGMKTSTAALILNLPPLSGVSDGDWVDLIDTDFNAASNNVTINAEGSDTLQLWGVSGASATISVSGTHVVAVANSGYWGVSVW